MMMLDGFSGARFNQSSRLVPFVEVACQSYLSQFYTVSPESAKTFTSLCHEQTPTEQILLLDLPYKWILVAQKMQNSFNNFLFNGVHLYTILSQKSKKGTRVDTGQTAPNSQRPFRWNLWFHVFHSFVLHIFWLFPEGKSLVQSLGVSRMLILRELGVVTSTDWVIKLTPQSQNREQQDNFVTLSYHFFQTKSHMSGH